MGRLRTPDARSRPSVRAMHTVVHRAPPAGEALGRRARAAGDLRRDRAGGAARDAHLLGLPRGRPRVQAQEAGRPAFVDYGTPERRRALCEEEVRLNRRLAPDVYLGTKAVIATAEGVALAPAPRTRCDRSRRRDAALRRGPDARGARLPRRRVLPRAGRGGPTARRVPRRARRFLRTRARRPHCTRRSPRTPTRCSLTRPTASSHARSPPSRASPRPSSAHAAPSSRGAAAAGRVRDGHGDLRAEHVLLERGVEIVDCLEFDPALRTVDVGVRPRVPAHGPRGARSPAAARAVLDSYRARAAIPATTRCSPSSAVYRALVRAKVALVRAGQSADPARLIDYARARVVLAERFAWRARQPGLVIFAGLSATGKTRLASALAARSGLRHLNSDPVRKRLLGLAPAARAGAAAYGEELQPPHLRRARPART